jgi:hypothetical protein
MIESTAHMTKLTSARLRMWCLAAMLASMLAPACGVDRPVQATAVQVGRVRNTDKSIAQQTTDFKPTDTIYGAVILEGWSSNVSVHARWTMPGGQLSEADQTLDVKDRGVAGFELRSGAGFPPGKYRFDVTVNGAPAGFKEMQVR